MGGTKDYAPADAVISISVGKSYFDLGIYVLAILRAEWRPGLTDGIVPEVHFKSDMKSVIFHDLIEVVRGTTPAQPAGDIGYAYENIEQSVNLDVQSSAVEGETHIIKVNEEIRRIIQLHRKDPLGITPPGITGRRYLTWYPNQQVFDRSMVGSFRRIGKVKLDWRFRQVS